MNAQEAPHCPSGLSLAQPVDGVEAAVMRSAAVSVIPAIVHLLSEHGLCGVRGSVVTLKTQSSTPKKLFGSPEFQLEYSSTWWLSAHMNLPEAGI